MKVPGILSLVPIFGLILVSCNRQSLQETQASNAPAKEIASHAEPIPNREQTETQVAEAPVEGLSATPVQGEIPGTHQDHEPKHGGTFFMALDNVHHLEGVLTPPGILRVYLYDPNNHPVKLEHLKQARGWVQWGESEDAPEIALTLDADEQCLEAVYDRELAFPITLTLRLLLPGTPPGERPEIFTFPFSHYSKGSSSS